MNFRVPLFFLLGAGPLHAGAQNLLTNGGAEAGAATIGWTVVTAGTTCATGFTGGWRVQGSQTGFPAARSGSWYFTAGCSSVQTEIYQDVSVAANATSIDAGTYTMTFSGWTSSFLQSPPDVAEVVVEYRNASSAVLSSYTTGSTTNTAGWVRYVHTRALPAGTRTVRVRLLGRTGTGPFQDAYFDDIALTPGPNPLPLSITAFSSTQHQGGVRLRWEDARLTAGTSYILEWSTDAGRWQGIASFSGTEARSEFLHTSPASGRNFYRIRVTDAAGSSSYTTTLLETLESERPLFSAPNPASGTLQVRMREDLRSPAAEISLISIDGRLVRRLNSDQNVVRIDIADLPSGLYFLKAIRGAEQSTQRLVIRN